METCDKCGKEMVQREGPKGRFYGCKGFPACRNTKQLEDVDPRTAPKTPQKASSYDSEVLERLATRLDSIDKKLENVDEKLDNVVKYFIDNKKDEVREKSWMPPQSSAQSGTPSPQDGSFLQESGSN